MLANNLRIVLRQLTKSTAFTGINLVGLLAATAVCLFIAQFVCFEYSFEQFNKNAARTYRINLYNTSNGIFEGITPATVSGLAYAMRQSLDGIESIGRVSEKVNAVVFNPEAQTRNLEAEIVMADPSVIDILAIGLIFGDESKILRTPQSIVISESAALTYFGRKNIVGRVLELGFPGPNIQMKSFSVDGVFSDIPSNSHTRFDFILPPDNEQAWNENWAWSNVSTYLRLAPNSAAESLDKPLAEIVKQHHQDNSGDKYLLESLRDIRLHALDGSGRAPIVNFFLALGFVILLLAWLNYVGLSTARFLERMKEVGLRKLLGASRKQLIFQLLMESLVFNIISLLCAMILFIVIWPFAASYFQIPSSMLILERPATYFFLAIALMIGVIASGLYPSFFLSSFRPLQSIKGQLHDFADRSTLRKVLVIIQLAISLTLITAVFGLERQLNFLKNQSLGISLEQTLIVDAPLLTDATTVNKYEPLKNEINRLSSVTGVTYASSFPGAEIDWHRADIKLNEENAPYRYDSRVVSIGTEFLDVFSLKILEGRNFKPELENDKKAMLINEEASTMFGFRDIGDAIGKNIFIGSRRFEVIGVLKNYHFRSLQYQLQPILFIQGYPRNPALAIKLSSDNVTSTISMIEQKWKETYPNNVFSYYFLDEKFEQQYLSDRQVKTVVGWLTGFAAIISFLGLFGLSLYTVNRRSREIGVRKVLGASAANILVLLSKDYAKLVIIAYAIGTPLSYQVSKVWLQKYAYQMPLDLSLFILPMVILVLLSGITISIKTTKAANTNPVDCLRNE